MENVKRINKFLADHYGKSFDGIPKFRVVWSEDLFETRKGQFSQHIIYEDVREAPKYMGFADRWILEIYTLAYPEVFGKALEHKNEIVKKGDGYEPLRVFQTRKGEYLKPDLEVCKIICDRWVELVNRPEGQRLTKKQASYNDVQKMKAETQRFFELLSANDDDMLAGRFINGSAVIIHRP